MRANGARVETRLEFIGNRNRRTNVILLLVARDQKPVTSNKRPVTSNKMKLIETNLPGVVLIEPTVFPDARGFFYESYHAQKFADFGITANFVQDNHARSSRGTLRGLHYQLLQPQAKLCRVVSGEVFDVAVDI